MCIIAAAGMISGCALRDVRDDYDRSQASAGLWESDRPFELIDWNFPTSRNQPPLEAPKRIRLDRTAIGVTWATRNPLPLSDNVAPNDPPRAGDDGPAANKAPSRSDRGDDRDSARARERLAVR
ncbi:MAG TPA: hypothetical protein VFS06_02940 [Casimicrobiaceae bacterium]|jgi:hypothetical protein|nr:hypothetical protein [Casimicrobiaceae bacterium]